MIQGTEDTRYAFVNGIVRAREARLLTKGHLDRLISSPVVNFSTILADTVYGGYEDVVAGFDTETAAIGSFLRRYCETPYVLHLVDWPEQIHNLKVKLKEGNENLYYPQSEVDVETWPEIADVIAAFAVDKDPFFLSTNLDKILCKYLYEISQFGLFFSTYYRLYFDLENIRSFFRARQFEKSREIFEQVFIDYGTLDKSVFIENVTNPYDALAKRFFTTPYAHIVDRGGAYLEEQHSFLRLERLCEEMKLRFLLQARNMTFGVEPLFCYHEFKLAEIRKLRQVYWGRTNEVPIDELRESIPDVW